VLEAFHQTTRTTGGWVLSSTLSESLMLLELSQGPSSQVPLLQIESGHCCEKGALSGTNSCMRSSLVVELLLLQWDACKLDQPRGEVFTNSTLADD
jgi:hypothetical protein